jgi:hypothetical protein
MEAEPHMSMLAAILMIALLGLVLAIVLRPLNAAPSAASRRRSRRSAKAAELADLRARREAKYQEIRDAELDYGTGKLSHEDHEAVDVALRREALQILDRIAELERAGSGDFLQQDDRVEHEHDREEDGPAVEVALDHRAAAKRPRAGADAEGP